MNDPLSIIDLMITVAGMALSILGLIQAIMFRQLGKKTRQYFIIIFAFIILYVSSSLVSQFSYLVKNETGAFWERISIFTESAFSSLLMPILVAFLLECAGEKNIRKNRFFIISMGLWFVYIDLLIFTQFSTVIYTISSDNTYSRGPFYPVLLVPTVLLMLLNLFALYFYRQKLSKRLRKAFFIYLLVPMISMLIQMTFYGVNTILLGTIIAAFFIFTYIVKDQTEHYYRQQAENEKLKVDVLMAQIKPHFIYNSLTAIRSYLDEPEKAEEVLNHFAGFLRGSIDMLSEKDCIRADREFATCEDYLYMAKERFGEKLDVKMELNDTDFMLPAFSVQTLVENAINHGIRKKPDGQGSLVIKSYKTEMDHVVEVKDDGVGMIYPLPDNKRNDNEDDRSHIGISNLEKRLALMCNGRLEIESRPGEGTLVKILIPLYSGPEKIGGGNWL
ncbi:MAG: histidine kinase [Lachnospiraceae bacterium]|nr:histidine kinase [Lachnospiraceae bacterium]